MIEYYFSNQIKTMDRVELEKCPSHLTLIERVGRKCARLIAEEFSPRSAAFFCGKGNNGRDGLFCAMALMEMGIDCTVVLCGADIREYVAISDSFGSAPRIIDLDCMEKTGGNFDVIIDALLGIGQARDVYGVIAQAVNYINRLDGVKISIDLPTGISSDSGEILGACVDADMVYTISQHKPGLYVYPAKEHIKAIQLVDVGIPKLDIAPCGYTLTAPMLDGKRTVRSNKGTYGRTVCFVGSEHMSGAAYLCAHSAYLAGTGIVEIVTHRENRVILSSLLPEAIVTCYDSDTNIEELTLSALSRASSVVIGCGIGMGEIAKAMTQIVAEHCTVPQLYDADAINIMAKYSFRPRSPHLAVLTPHFKEFERLTGIPLSTVEQCPLSHCRALATSSKTVCLLKDANTVIARPDGKFYINTTGNPGMSTGGSGDVLAGIIGGLLSFDHGDIGKTTANGAYIHGAAGDIAMETVGMYSMTARDIMNNIPQIMKKIK